MSTYISFRIEKDEFDDMLSGLESRVRAAFSNAASNVTVNIDEAGVEAIKESTGDYLDEMALNVAASASGPVDTGFLNASVYVHSKRQSTFDATWPSDYYPSTKTGQLRARERIPGPVEPSDPDGVVVGWAAVYAQYAEVEYSFGYQALMGQAGAEDRGPLNLGGRRFVSPRGGASSGGGSDYIDRNNPNFVSPDGPTSDASSSVGRNPGDRNFVSPDGPGADRPGDRGVDRSSPNFVAP